MTAVEELAAALRKAGSPERAKGAKAYMKSSLEFFGVTQADVRKTAATFVKANRDLDRKRLLALVQALYDQENFDLRSVAIGVLERRARELEAEDLPLLVDLIHRSACWAHVDWLSVKVLPCPLAKLRDPAAVRRQWARDDDFWLRRAALLVDHDPLKDGEGDFELFTELAVPMLGEKEFFIRKAIGWILREVSKRRPDPVRTFIKKHGAKMSGLTRREAEKYL